MAKELRYKVTKDKGKKSEEVYEGTDKDEAMKIYKSTKPDKGGKVHLLVGQFEGEKLIGGYSFLKIKNDSIMAKVKYVCGGCQSEVNDSDNFCTECGVNLKPVTDATIKVSGSNYVLTVEEGELDVLENALISAQNKGVFAGDTKKVVAQLLKKINSVPSISDDSTEGFLPEMTDEEFDATHDALELIEDASVKTKIRGNSISQMLPKLKAALETSLFNKERIEKLTEQSKDGPEKKAYFKEEIKKAKERKRVGDDLINMWFEGIKQAIKK